MKTSKLPQLPKSLRDTIVEVNRTTCKRIADRCITEWVEDNAVLAGSYGATGPFRFSDSNYLREPLKAMQDWETSTVAILKAVQTFGTGTAELFLQWAIENRPLPTLWVCQKDDAAKKEMNTRIKPSLLANDHLRGFIPNSRKIKSDGIEFAHMDFTIVGPSINNLQSSTRGIVICDELAFWEHDNLFNECKNRTNYFAEKGMSKIIVVSQAGDHDGELNEVWKYTTQEDWSVPCPECKTYFVPYVTQFNASGKPWNDIELKLKDDRGDYDFGKLEKVLTLECPTCKHLMQDSLQLKNYWNENGKYVVGNHNSLKGHRGFRWNAIHCSKWIGIVQDYILACRARKKGDPAPFQKFFQKRMARPINPEEFFASKRQVKTDIPYDKTWPEEKIRVMTIDVQEHHFVAVIRAWSADGKSRLLWCGRLMTIQDVLDKQLEYNIPYFETYGKKTYYVAWDTGNPVRIREVYQYIVKYNHIGIKGEVERKGYVESYWDKRANRKIEKYRTFKKSVTGGDPNIGTPLQGKGPKAELYLIATDTLKKILTQLRDGHGSEWLCLPMTAPFMDEYNKSMFSEYSKMEIKGGKSVMVWKKVSHEACNDYWDAENYNLAVAIMCGINIQELITMPTNEYINVSTSQEAVTAKVEIT